MSAPAKTPPQTSPLLWLMLLLSVSTGLVDAISVLGLGKVFTANMTGNIVFLGFAASGMPGFFVAPYIVSIAAFLLGALIAGRTGRALAGNPLRRWLIMAALVEAALLWIAAVVALGFDVDLQTPQIRLYAMIALTAVAMGFRNATIRQLKVTDMTTTVLTMTLTGLAADFGLAGGTNTNWQRRLGSVIAIFLGAAVGALMVFKIGLALPLALAGALVLLGTIAAALHPSSASPVSA